MIDPTYGTSFLHRLPAGLKLSAVFIISIALFYFSNLTGALIALAIILGLYLIAGFSLSTPFHQLRNLLWLLGALFLLQLLSASWQASALVVVRLAALFLFATLVNLTTPVAKMLSCFERCFSFVTIFRGNPAKIALTLSLTLRFIPLFSQITREVREAQKARGFEKNILALTIPTIIRILKMQDDIAAAIEARCYDAKNKSK